MRHKQLQPPTEGSTHFTAHMALVALDHHTDTLRLHILNVTHLYSHRISTGDTQAGGDLQHIPQQCTDSHQYLIFNTHKLKLLRNSFFSSCVTTESFCNMFLECTARSRNVVWSLENQYQFQRQFFFMWNVLVKLALITQHLFSSCYIRWWSSDRRLPTD